VIGSRWNTRSSHPDLRRDVEHEVAEVNRDGGGDQQERGDDDGEGNAGDGEHHNDQGRRERAGAAVAPLLVLEVDPSRSGHIAQPTPTIGWRKLDVGCGSAEAHRQEHVTVRKGLYRVRHIRFQHEHLAAAEPMPRVAGLDRQLAPKAVNHHLTRGSVLREPTA
jgi:hypothetical protein